VPNQNVRGTVGLPTPGTDIRVVDPETREDMPDGSQGLLLAKGGGVMVGYYKDDAATKKAIDADGWFDTGDLGWRAPSGYPFIFYCQTHPTP
jgi:long-chain acyl-CoA synthetase